VVVLGRRLVGAIDSYVVLNKIKYGVMYVHPFVVHLHLMSALAMYVELFPCNYKEAFFFAWFYLLCHMYAVCLIRVLQIMIFFFALDMLLKVC
jgi:hypothetical protein